MTSTELRGWVLLTSILPLVDAAVVAELLARVLLEGGSITLRSLVLSSRMVLSAMDASLEVLAALSVIADAGRLLLRLGGMTRCCDELQREMFA